MRMNYAGRAAEGSNTALPAHGPDPKIHQLEEVRSMTILLRGLWRDEAGQGMTEYALIIALVAVAIVAVVVLFREQIKNVFTRATTELQNAPG